MSMTPVGLYGLEVPPGNVLIPAMQEDSYPDACVSDSHRAGICRACKFARRPVACVGQDRSRSHDSTVAPACCAPLITG